jgi:hypothetical protein
MTIATAVQKGQFIYVYDANGRELCHIYVGITGTLQRCELFENDVGRLSYLPPSGGVVPQELRYLLGR